MRPRGGAAITQQSSGLDPAGVDLEQQLFALLSHYPDATVTEILAVVLVAVFFVMGADSASFVAGILSQRGTEQPHRTVIVFWGAMMGAVAAVMLIVGGADALEGLESLTILVAAPFVVIMVLLCVSLIRDLDRDPLVLREQKGAEVLGRAVGHGTGRYGDPLHPARPGRSRRPAPPPCPRRRAGARVARRCRAGALTGRQLALAARQRRDRRPIVMPGPCSGPVGPMIGATGSGRPRCRS